MLMINALALAFVTMAGAAGGPVGVEEGLFGPTAEDSAVFGALEPWELRKQLAAVNASVLLPWCDPPDSGQPDTVTLNLFPDLVLIGTADKISRTGKGTLLWRGGVQDVPDSAVTLSAIGLCDGNPKFSLAGSARINGEEFTLEPRSGGRVVITEIDTMTSGLLQKPARGDDTDD